MSDEPTGNISSNVVAVTGIVTPAAWDDDGKVIEVMLEWQPPEAEDLEELLLDPGTTGRSLQRFVGRLVSATGTISTNEDGDWVMVVSQFRPYRPLVGDKLAS